MAITLTGAQIFEFQEAFAMFDKKSSGKISTKELCTVMRALGQKPTEAEMIDMLSELTTDAKGDIDFYQFTVFMAQKMLMDDSVEEIVEAFRAFDGEGKGFISAKDLRHVMTSAGEKFSDDEMDEFLSYAEINGDGLIDYEAFIATMLK